MKIPIIACLLLCATSVFAQTATAEKVQNAELTQFIGNVSGFRTYKLEHNAVNVVVVANQSGSAKSEGSDEVSRNVYVSLCQYGEDTDCSLFVVKDRDSPGSQGG